MRDPHSPSVSPSERNIPGVVNIIILVCFEGVRRLEAVGRQALKEDFSVRECVF